MGMMDKPKTYASLPLHCQECGLHKTCQSYKIPGRSDPREFVDDHDNKRRIPLEDKPYIMIVGQSPGRNEDFQGKVFIGPSGAFLNQFLTNLGVRWYVTNAVRCYQGTDAKGADNKLNTKQIQACSTYLMEDIKRYQPRVIICLGEWAIKAVLGKTAPKSVKEAARNVYSFGEDSAVKVLCHYHPVNDKSVRGDKDLFDPYLTMFHTAQRIATGEYEEQRVEFTITREVDDPGPPAKVKELIYDIEDTHNDNDPGKKTIFHPGSRMLCFSVTWKDGNTYHTRTYAGPAVNTGNLLRCIKGRRVIGHNLKYDFLASQVFLGVNPHDYVTDFFDTFHFWFLQDQSKFGNGLKEIAANNLQAPNWASPIKLGLKAIIAQKQEINKELRKENRKLIKENPDAELHKEVLEVADLGDLPEAMVLEYNANDTYWNARIFYELVPQLPAISETLWEMTMKSDRCLQRMEYFGLPSDEGRLKRVAHAARVKLTHIHKLLHKLPEVQAVHDGWARVCLNQLGEEYIEAWGPAPFNPHSWKWLESLAYKMDYHTWEVTEGGTRLAFDKNTWKEICGKEGERTREQWVWYYVYHYRQLKHLAFVFIKNLVEYTVDGRIHTTFKSSKSDSEDVVIGGDVTGGIESGRIGSSNPNLLNLKKDTLLRGCLRVTSTMGV